MEHRHEKVPSEGARPALPVVASCLALALTLGLPARPATAQSDSARYGAIAGVVRDEEGHGLTAAEVVVVNDDRQRAVSDDDGNFLLRRIPLGTVTLSVRRLGYRPQELSTILGRANEAQSLTVVLVPLPQRIAAVEVRGTPRPRSGPMADFYRRLESRANGGHFFTRAQIDSLQPQRTTDLLRRVPGLNFVTNSRDGYDGSIIKSRDRRCSPLIWIDGTPAATNYFDPDLVNPRTIEGIEIYSGVATVPQALTGPAGTSSCGAIAIWTREGDPAPNRPDEQKRAGATALAPLVDSVQVYTEAQVDQIAQLAPTTRFTPEYPDELRRSHATGVVVAEFVVDAAGHVERPTIGVVYSPHPLFTAAVSAALETAVFTPAVRAGHAVRQLVQLPVRFVNPTAR